MPDQNGHTARPSMAAALGPLGQLDLAGLSALEAELAGKGEFAALRSLYDLAVGRAPDPDIGRELMLKAGLLAKEKLGDPAMAEMYLRRVLSTDPESPDAIDALRALLEDQGRLDEAASLLDAAIVSAPTQEKVDLLIELAEIAHGGLDQPDRASAALRYAFSLAPERLDVLHRARALFLAESRLADAKLVLDAEAEARLTAPTATGEDHRIIAEAYRALGERLLETPLDHPMAEDALGQARKLGDSEALSRLDEIAHLRQNWEQKATTLRADAMAARDKRRAAELYVGAAELFLAYGNDPLRSEEALKRALILSPGFPAALRLIERSVRDPSRAADAVGKLVGAAADVKDPGTKAKILLRAARLAATLEVNVPEKPLSRDAYKRVLAIEPGQAEAAFAYAACLEQNGVFGEQAEVLEKYLAATDSPHTKLGVHLELGRLYAQLLGDTERARAHFEAALRISPGNYQAATALRALYIDLRNARGVLEMHWLLIEHTPERTARVTMLDEVLEMARAVGREETFAVLLARYTLEPRAEIEPELEQQAIAVGKSGELADKVVELAKRLGPAQATDRWALAGRLYDRAGRAREAVEAMKKVLEAHPKDVPIRDALERLLRERNDPQALVDVLESQLARTSIPADGAPLLAKLGAVRDRELNDLPGARAAYEKMLAFDPHDVEALSSLDELLGRMSAPADRAAIIARREALVSGRDRAELAARRTRILSDLGHDAEAATVGLSALAELADDVNLIAFLHDLSSRAATAEIATALEPIYAQRGQHDRQVEMLGVLIDVADSAGDDRKVAELARRAARLLETKLDRTEAALDMMSRAATAEPSDNDTLEQVTRLARQLGRPERAAGLFTALLKDATTSPAGSSATATALGTLYDEVLERKGEAIEAFRMAIDADAGNAIALSALERLLGAEQRWGDLAKLMQDRLARTEDRAAKVELGLRLAALQDERAGDTDGAIEAVKGLLSTVPGDPRALSRLAQLLEKKGEAASLIDVLDQTQNASNDPDVKSALDLRAADLERTSLGRPKSAFGRYARVLERRPTDEAAIRGLELLAKDEPELRSQSAALLVPVYRTGGRPHDLSVMLEIELDATEDRARRRALYGELARVNELELNQPVAAWATLSRAFSEDLVDPTERGELARVALAANQGPALAELFEKKVTESPEDLELLRALSRLYEGAVLSPERAAKAWNRVLAKVPGDSEALGALERLHASGDDPAALAEVLLRRARATQGPDAVALLKRAAAIYEEAVEDLPRARAAMEEARKMAPEDRNTLTELQRLAQKLGDGAAVIALRQAEAELALDPKERADVWVRLAGALADQDRYDEAIDAYQKVSELAPDRAAMVKEGLESMLDTPAKKKAALALEPIYRKSADWPKLVEVYESLATVSTDPAERVERLLAIRTLWEERLKNPERAFQAASRAFRDAPTNDDVLASLERLAKPARAHEDLVGLYEDGADALPAGSDGRAILLIRLARFLESLRVDRKHVMTTWRRVVSERPRETVALEAIVRLGTDMGDFDIVVQALEALSTVLEGPALQIEKLRSAARILEIQAGDPARIVRVHERILSITPGDQESLLRLETLYQQTGRFRDLERVLTEASTRAPAGAQQVNLRLRLGRLLAGKLEDPEAALGIFASVIEDRAGGQESLLDAAVAGVEAVIESAKSTRPALAAKAANIVEPIWRQKGLPGKLVEAKKAQAEASTDVGEKRRLTLEVSSLYEKDLSQPEMAFLTLTRLYEEHPGDPALGSELERLAKIAETREELADVYAGAIGDVTDESQVLVMARTIAEIYDKEVNRGSDAIPFYERILSSAPDDKSLLDALERLHRAGKDARGVVRVLRRRLELASTSAHERRSIADELARILESDLGDVEGAFEAYRARLVVDPKDRAALIAVAELAAREGRATVLADALARLAEIAEKADEKAAILIRLGKTRKDGLRDPVSAVDAFAEALKVKKGVPGAMAELGAIFKEGGPARVRAAEVLAPVLEESGAYADLITVLEARLEGADPAAKKALLVQIADIYEDNLGKAEHAFHAVCRALHEDLADEALRGRVERVARENGLLEDLAAFYLDEVDQALDHELAVTLRKKAADIYEKDLDDTARAITEHTRVLELLPGDPSTLQALERLYKVGGQFQSLAEVYRRRIAQAEEVGARAALMRELARVQAEFLKESPAAIATLRRLLELVPDDLEALERLVALCARENRPSELADALERLIAASETREAPADNHRLQLAKLRVEKLEDRVGGDALIRDILTRDPHNGPAKAYLKERLEDAVSEDDPRQAMQVADLLANAHRQAGEAQPLIEVLRVRAGLTADKDARVELHREIASLYRDVLKQPELAFGALTQAFRDAPDHDALRGEMEALARELLLVEELVEAYEEALPRLDPDARTGLGARIAELYETSIGNRDKALASWESVLKRRPMDPIALEALDRLNSALGRWGALTDVLEKRLELAEEDEANAYDVLVRLGTVWEERLDEKDEAIATYRRARAIRPREPRVLRALARLLDAKASPDELFAVLQSLAEKAEPQELKEIYPRLAQLASEHFGDRPQSVELWKRLVEIEPTNALANSELDRLYELDEKWTDLVALLERQLKAAKDEREVSRVSRRLALIRGTKLGNVDDAIESWTGILRKNPSDVEALDALRKIYRSGGRWDELVGVLRKLVPLQTNADGVKSIRFELAEVFLQHLAKRDEAIEAAKRVLDVEPHTMAQLLRLEEIFVSAGAHHDAVRVMTLRVDQSEDPGEKVDVLFTIAQIYELKLARRQGAASSYERILQIQADNTRAYEALAALYEQAGDYRKLVEIMSRRLEEVQDPEARRTLLFAIIEVQEKRLGHKDLAFSSACRAFGEEGADPRAQAIAERLAAETDGWEILAEVIDGQVDEVPVPRAVELRKRLAEICVEELDDLGRAEKQLDLVISVRPDDDQARAALGQIYLKGERWRDFINLTLDRVELTMAGNVQSQAVLLRDIAHVEETKLELLDAAVRTYRRILTNDAGDEAALDEIIRLLEAQNDARALIEALEGKAARKDDDGERAEVRHKIAELWEEQLGEPSRAIEAYRDVLLLDPAHDGALFALERLYTKEKRFEDLVEVYERQVELASSPDKAVSFLASIAKLQDAQFNEPERAAITLERALETQPRHVPTMEALEAILARLGVWSRLVDIYERHLAEVTHRDRSIELLLALGEVQDLRLERRDLAEKTYQNALAKDPSHKEAIHRLGDLFERQGSWFNALEMLGKEARLVGAGPEAVELNYRVGKINADMLGDIPGAKVAFKRAIEIDTGSLKAIRALAELFRDEGRWDDVLGLEIQEAEATDDDHERATRWQRAAETAFDRLEKPEEAKRLYERALEADEDHVPSLRALADLCFIDESYERAEQLLEKLVSLLDRDQAKDEMCRQYYRLAYISEKLGDDEHALTRYLESYEIDSTYLPTLEGLAAALLRAERWQDAQRIYQTILVHHRESLTDAEVVDLYFQLGDLAARLNDHDRARRSFDRALELDPNHVLTLRGYATLTEQLEEWEEAYDHRARLIDLLAEDERFDALMLQAKLCREKISDPYRAVDALSEARRLKTDDVGVLSQLSELYQETSQHAKAVDVLNDLLAVTKVPVKRRDLGLQIANVEEAQNNWNKAVDALNIALDADPLYVKAFERLETLLAQHGKWQQLEENYRKMIERLPKDSSQRIARAVLWKALGDLYRMKLKSHDGARTAYEVVLKLKPEDHAVATTLAQLLAQKRDTAGEAIKIYHRLMSAVDDPSVPIREVYPLYEALGQRDRVLCALGAVLLMRVAQPNEQRIYEILLKAAPTVPTKVLDEKAWRLQLFHPDNRTTLADLLSVLYRGAPDLFAEPQNQLALKKKEKIEVGAKGRGGLLYFNVWRIVSTAMGLTEMDHYHRPGLGTPPRLYPGPIPVLFAGENHEVFREMPPKQLAWVISRQVACLRPELAPVRALSPEEVGAAAEGAIRLFLPEGSGVNLGVDPRLIAQWTKNLQRSLGERALKALRTPVQAALERGDMKTLPQYLRGVDHTVSRAALLFAGDARVADRFIGEPDRIIDDVSDRRRARELMLFSMSEDFFSLRTQLGLALAPAK